MDYDKLIEHLRRRGLGNGSALGHHSGLYEDAALAIETLRGPTREQVEKVWRGEWEDMRESYNDVPKRRCSRCKSVFIGLDTPFCGHCGAPMTDEAVEIVMRRLEELHDTSN